MSLTRIFVWSTEHQRLVEKPIPDKAVKLAKNCSKIIACRSCRKYGDCHVVV